MGKELQSLERRQQELLKEKNMCKQSIQENKLGKYYTNIETIYEEKEEDESDKKEREQEQQDYMRNKDTDDEPKDTDEKEQQDNMRNKYNCNLSLPEWYKKNQKQTYLQ